MPKHLQTESGFEDMSSIGDDGSGGASRTTPHKRTANLLEDEIDATKKHRQYMNSILDKVAGYLESHQQQGTKPEDDVDCAIKKVAQYSQMMSDNTVLDTMSPASKDAYVSTLQKQRRHLLAKVATAENDNDVGEGNSD